MTLDRHPFDPPEESAAPADGDPAEAGGAGSEPEREQEQDEGQQVEAADGQADKPEEGDDGGQSKADQSHGPALPAPRPFSPAQLRQVLTAWHDQLVSFDERAIGLHQVQAAVLSLGEVEAELVERLVEEMPGPWVETPVGILKRDRRGGSSSWDAEIVWADALAEARRRAGAIDDATGEIDETIDRGIQAMLGVVKEIVSSPSFRVGALKKMGVEPDEVRATSPSRKIVRFA